MRVLLLDNYDSYTYNLYQLLATAYGQPPVVMVNDDPRLSSLDPSGFDCVVISPGPGRPQHAPDLGWCWDVLEQHPDLPVLGVCLGHQAIGYHAGADVRVGVPKHGHVARIRHDGTGLFAGLPQHFAAVRYHSLHVPEPMPPDLSATAWAEDGTVMGLRHRTLPRWGVQFHPESIATEHGVALLHNLARLVGRPAAGDRPPAAGGARSAPAGAAGLQLTVEVLDHEVDPGHVFRELYGERRYAFWLDGAAVTAGRSRFSFLGDDSGPLAEVLSYRTGAGVVEVRTADRTEQEPGSIFEALQRRLARRRVSGGRLPFDFDGGYVGYFGYEMKAECGGTNIHTSPGPDAVWMFADRLIAVDHLKHRTYVVALSPPGGRARREARDWVRRTIRVLRPIGADPAGPAAAGQAAADPAAAPAAMPATPDEEPLLSRPRPQYLADIEACLDELRQGESYEICLTNRVRIPAIEDPFAYYLALRRINPAPYAAFLRLGEVSVMSASPERFLRIDPDGTVESKPIKGTSRRHPDPRVDERLRAELESSAKTRAELLMIIDLLRNDLGRVCRIGSVSVPTYMATESYATVHQLVSTIRGRLLPGVDAVGCVRHCFPGGSMTGAPKIRTMEIIDRLEGEARGIYSGTLGYFGLGGGADLSIVIRTAVATPDGVTIGTGGAIVLDSDPEAEFAETLLKAASLVRTHRLVADARR